MFLFFVVLCTDLHPKLDDVLIVLVVSNLNESDTITPLLRFNVLSIDFVRVSALQIVFMIMIMINLYQYAPL